MLVYDKALWCCHFNHQFALPGKVQYNVQQREKKERKKLEQSEFFFVFFRPYKSLTS